MKFVRLWGPVIAWMAIIFAFSSRQRIEVSEEPVLNFLFFKTLHVIEYAILYFLSFRAIRNSTGSPHQRHFYWWAFWLTIAYAVSDEVHQTFTPTREGKPRDVIIDAAGAILAWYLIKKLLPIAPRKLQRLAKRWQIAS